MNKVIKPISRSDKVMENIDIYNENDSKIQEYNDICLKYVKALNSALTYTKTNLPQFTSDEFKDIFEALCQIRDALLPDDPEESEDTTQEYIGVYPCIDSMYTVIKSIRRIIKFYRYLLNNVKSLKLLLVLRVNISHAHKYTDHLLKLIEGILNAKTMANNIQLNNMKNSNIKR